MNAKPSRVAQTGAPDPFTRISEFYDELVEKYGHDPRACDYGRPESQAIKFKVLGDVAELSGKHLLDVGCGFADFADYLRDRYPGISYTGIDLSPRMIGEAQRLHPELVLRHGNFAQEIPAGEFDVVTANGIFYLLGASAETHMRAMVSRMFQIARVAVAFNSLSSWAGDQEAGEFYADPLKTVEFCRTLTPCVVLRHDYHTRDFTVYLYHDRTR